MFLITVLKFQILTYLLVVMFLLFGIELPSQLLFRCVLFKYLWNIVLKGFQLLHSLIQISYHHPL